VKVTTRMFWTQAMVNISSTASAILTQSTIVHMGGGHQPSASTRTELRANKVQRLKKTL